LKAGRLQAGWEKLEHYGVIKEVTDGLELRQRAVEQHLEALRIGKTSLMISPRHDEARKVAAVVRQQLKAQGAIGAEDHAVNVLRRMDIGLEACRDLLHYARGRVVGFHTRTAGGFKPGQKCRTNAKKLSAFISSVTKCCRYELPRDLSTNQLIKALRVLCYSIDHQRGSHIRIVTSSRAASRNHPQSRSAP
jgi:hypothetical protein